MTFIRTHAAVPLGRITSPARLATGGAILMTGLAFAINNLLMIG